MHRLYIAITDYLHERSNAYEKIFRQILTIASAAMKRKIGMKL